MRIRQLRYHCTALAVAVMTVGCGNGSEPLVTIVASMEAGPVGPIGTAGIFAINYGQFHGVYTLLDDGRFSGLHFVGDLAGHPRGVLSADNSTSSLDPITWANFIDDTGMLGTQDSNAVFGRSFDVERLDVIISGAVGTFSASTYRQVTYSGSDSRTLYGVPLPMSSIAG